MVTKAYLKEGLIFNALKAMEEAGEFIQATCKALSYGWESVDPTLPEDQYREQNIDWVLRELQDTKYLLTRLEEEIYFYKEKLANDT